MHSQKQIAACCLAIAATWFAAPAAHAQFGPWWFGGNYGGGTVDGNYMSRAAQVIRAAGDYNVATTQGMKNYEDARSKYIDNENRWTQAYFQMREANQRYQRYKFESSRHSPETLAKVAESDRPRLLTAEEYNPVSGRIVWPDVPEEMDPEYAYRLSKKNWSSSLKTAARRPKPATGR